MSEIKYRVRLLRSIGEELGRCGREGEVVIVPEPVAIELMNRNLAVIEGDEKPKTKKQKDE